MDRKGSLNDAADDHPKDEIALEHIDVTLTEEAPSHHPLDRKVLWKVDLWLMPITCVLMMIAYLDRTAIGNARLFGLEQDLNMAGSDYNIALFMFFVPYILLDLPSNILMKRLRPSVYLSILMFCWGVITICQGVTHSFAGLVVCRFLLGALEAGYFPGALFLMSMYYTRFELQTRVNLWYSAGVIASAFGGLLAYAIGHMDGVSGYSAWRWVFILEGVLTVAVSGIAFFVLPDWPEQAKFLTADQKDFLLHKLERDAAEYVETKSSTAVLKDCLSDVKVYLCSAMYFASALLGTSNSFFLPSILRQLGWTALKAQYMSIPVWMFATFTSVTVGALSDHLKIRSPFMLGSLTFTCIGLAILLAQTSVAVGVRYLALFFMTGGTFASIGMSVGWLNNNVVGKKRRGISTGLTLAIGNCGSIVGSNVFLANEAPRYTTGYSVALACVCLAMGCIVANVLYLRKENHHKARGDQDHLLSLPAAEQSVLGDKHPSYRYVY